jgi:hypothetical protein
VKHTKVEQTEAQQTKAQAVDSQTPTHRAVELYLDLKVFPVLRNHLHGGALLQGHLEGIVHLHDLLQLDREVVLRAAAAHVLGHGGSDGHRRHGHCEHDESLGAAEGTLHP